MIHTKQQKKTVATRHVSWAQDVFVAGALPCTHWGRSPSWGRFTVRRREKKKRHRREGEENGMVR